MVTLWPVVLSLAHKPVLLDCSGHHLRYTIIPSLNLPPPFPLTAPYFLSSPAPLRHFPPTPLRLFRLSSESAGCMDGQSIVGAGPVPPSASHSPISPILRHGSIKRKRSNGGLDSSPESGMGDEDSTLPEPEKKRQPGVKRACNECRQQKVSFRSHWFLWEEAARNIYGVIWLDLAGYAAEPHTHIYTHTRRRLDRPTRYLRARPPLPPPSVCTAFPCHPPCLSRSLISDMHTVISPGELLVRVMVQDRGLTVTLLQR